MSARKARLVADSIRGLDISEALFNLTHSQKKAAALFRKLLLDGGERTPTTTSASILRNSRFLSSQLTRALP